MLEINKKLFNNLNEDNINYLVYKGLSHLEDDLNGKRGIFNALAKLGTVPQEQLALPDDMKAFGIVGALGLFSSHPPIEKRLKNIEEYKK